VNAELANDIGNLLSRTLVMVERFAQGRVPEPAADDGERPLARAAKEAYGAYAACLDRLELSNALGAVLELVKRANKYIEEQSPWDLAKVEGQRRRLDTVLYDLLETLRVSAVLLSPALTRAPAEILRQLGQDEPAAGLCLPAAAAFGQLRPGQSVRRGAALFPRIEDLPAAAAGPEPAAAAGPEPAAAAGPGPAAKAQIAAPKPEIVSYDEFARLELRVARVLRAEAVPRADRLLRLVVQLEGEERQLVAGIAAHYEPAALVGRDVVMVVNLEPATIRGVRSQGMILAASAEGSLCLVVPERPMPPGSRVK
jgi:methionyl-tRNA synthetase